VTYSVATDTAFQNMVTSGTVLSDIDKDNTVKITVSNLSPGGTYYYYFRAEGVNSLVGRAKTLPEGDVDHLRFGVVSCSNYEGGFFNA
jgi:alkaline phosphatase D